jgi:hypothetical protein
MVGERGTQDLPNKEVTEGDEQCMYKFNILRHSLTLAQLGESRSIRLNDDSESNDVNMVLH